MEIYLVRHTTPEIEKGTYYGQTDVPLVSSFEEDIRMTKAKLPKTFDAVYSSPLSRCLTLARELSTEFFKSDDRLMEMNLGDWEMKKDVDIPQEKLEHWTRNFDIVGPPNGESFEDLYQRIIPVFEGIVRESYDKVAIVTHGGVIRSVLHHLLEIPLNKSFVYTLDYGSVSLIEMPSPALPKVKYINR